jgi:hypothetical protein
LISDGGRLIVIYKCSWESVSCHIHKDIDCINAWSWIKFTFRGDDEYSVWTVKQRSAGIEHMIMIPSKPEASKIKLDEQHGPH